MSDDLLAQVRDGAWLDAQNFPPLTYAIHGIIPEGSCLLVGAPKIGKSWFVLSVALAAAAGGTVLDLIGVDQRPVLYAALEDGDRRMQSRCRMLLGDEPIPPRFEYLISVAPGRVVETIATWFARHPGQYPIAILDTLGKVMPPALPGESAYARDYRIGTELKRLTDEEHGRTLLINHHDRKAGAEDFIDSVSGTHGLAGAADTTVVLSRGRTEIEGLLKVTGRDIPEGQYGVRFNDGCRWSLEGRTLSEAAKVGASRAASSGLGERATEVVNFLATVEMTTPKEVALKFGMDDRVASNLLSRLADAGRIDKSARGRYRLPPQTPSESGESDEFE